MQPARWWKIPGYAPPTADCKDSGSTTEKAARSGRRAEGQTRTVTKRSETLEESAIQNPRARGPEGRAVLPSPNATPVLGLDRRGDSSVVYPSPIDRSFDVLDSRKPKIGCACPNNPSEHPGAEERKEAASAQAVKRGQQVTMVEIPDEEDDTAYRRWLQKGGPDDKLKGELVAKPTSPDSPKPTSRLPNEGVDPTYVPRTEVTSPMVAVPVEASAKAREVPHQWFKPFEVDWMLRAICEA